MNITPPTRPAITWGQHQAILRWLSADKRATRWPWWETLCRLAWSTGMRLSDCVLPTWEEVDFEDRTIVFVPKKTSRFRKVVAIPMDGEIHNYLSHLKSHPLREWHKRCNYVSPEGRGFYNDGKNNHMCDQFRYICERAGIGNEISFLSYRHAFFSRLVDAGVSLVVIASMTGATLATVLSYTHVSMEVKREVLNAAIQKIQAVSPKPVPTPPPLV